MAKVEISERLKQEIFKKFKGESVKVLDLLYSLKENPKKGKELGQVSGILVKELKYKNFRFYFIVSSYGIRFYDLEKLNELVIKIVRMSDKKSQQKTIDEIKHILRRLGSHGF